MPSRIGRHRAVGRRPRPLPPAVVCEIAGDRRRLRPSFGVDAMAAVSDVAAGRGEANANACRPPCKVQPNSPRPCRGGRVGSAHWPRRLLVWRLRQTLSGRPQKSAGKGISLVSWLFVPLGYHRAGVRVPVFSLIACRIFAAIPLSSRPARVRA